MKVKCTYPSCYKHFDSEAAMIKHKKKDSEHAYCGKCDVDCDDDMQLMIHQIESSKHSKPCGTGVSEQDIDMLYSLLPSMRNGGRNYLRFSCCL